MQIRRLRCLCFRRFEDLELAPGPGLNFLIGPNGSGKTSILEAVHMLSHGRSFRLRTLDSLARNGASGFAIQAELISRGGAHTLEMRRNAETWALQIDGKPQSGLAALLGHCAAICFDPTSEELISGGSEPRRRYLDWGVFHVEHDIAPIWRSYRRALRQRNALLRSGGAAEEFESWEHELARFAETIEQARDRYIVQMRPHLDAMLALLVPELGEATFRYRPGWNRDLALAHLLAVQRERDTTTMQTRSGAHRSDWSVQFDGAPGRDYLSRGQIKSVALACLFAQASLLADLSGEWPVICLDDLSSELDETHLERVLRYVRETPAQMLITAVRDSSVLRGIDATTFHVEHNGVTRV